MKIFRRIRGHLTMLGMEPTPSARFLPFNWKLLMGFIVFILGIGSCISFLCYKAEIIVEYIQCICVISLLIEIGFDFVAMAMQRRQLFNYIEIVEKLINTSKQNAMNHSINSFESRERGNGRLHLKSTWQTHVKIWKCWKLVGQIAVAYVTYGI